MNKPKPASFFEKPCSSDHANQACVSLYQLKIKAISLCWYFWTARIPMKPQTNNKHNYHTREYKIKGKKYFGIMWPLQTLKIVFMWWHISTLILWNSFTYNKYFINSNNYDIYLWKQMKASGFYFQEVMNLNIMAFV